MNHPPLTRPLARSIGRACRVFCAALALLLFAPPAMSAFTLQTTSLRDRLAFGIVIGTLDQNQTPIDAWATTARGEWIVVAGGNVYHSSNMSTDLVNAVKLNHFFGRKTQAITCRIDGLCVLVHSMGIYGTNTLPTGLATRVNWIHNNLGHPIRDLELTSGGGWVVVAGPDVWSYQIPVGLKRALDDRLLGGRTVREVGIGFHDEWVVVASGNVMSHNASPPLIASLQTATNNRRPRRFIQGPGTDFVTYTHNNARIGVNSADPTQAVEYLLGPSANTSIWRRMNDNRAVGVSIAIIEGNQVVSARGYGVLEAGTDRPVLGNTPFDIASLSKYVGALTTLREAEVNPTLTLATDVTTAPPAGGAVADWIDRVNDEKGLYGIPANVQDVPSGLTLTRLLSHTASMRTGGSPGVERLKALQSGPGETLDWLSGRGCDGWPCAWDGGLAAFTRANFGVPGNQYNYSNAGVYLAQAFLEDVTGATGAELMEEHLFDPMGLTDISGQYPPPVSIRNRRASQHDDGVRQVSEYYPMTFAGGVNASSKDYAELMVLALNRGRDSQNVPRLAPASIQALLTRTNYTNEAFEANPTHYGLGVGLRRYTAPNALTPLVGAVLETGNGVFAHRGTHVGLGRAVMCGMPSRDQGIVVMVNGDGPNITAFINEILLAFETANGWATTCGR